MLVIQLTIASWACSETLLLKATCKILNQHAGWCIFGILTFVPIAWMCKKPRASSHGSREGDMIVEGLPAKHFWEFVVDVCSPTNKAGGNSTLSHSQFEHSHVTRNEDYEAVIEIIKRTKCVMFPERTVLIWIRYSRRSIWIPTFLFVMSRRKSTLRTFLPRVHLLFLSRMMRCDWLTFAHFRVTTFQSAAHISLRNSSAKLCSPDILQCCRKGKSAGAPILTR